MSGKRKTERNYTVMLVPEGNERTHSFTVNRALLGVVFGVIAVFAIGVAVLLFKAGDIAVKLQLVTYLRDENRRLQNENDLLRTVAARLDSMAYLVSYMERLAVVLGVEHEQITPSVGLSAEQGIFTQDPHDRFLDEMRFEEGLAAGNRADGPATRPDFLASIPNIYPVEGWVTKQFGTEGTASAPGHKGVDFAAATGTPIRATAPGVVDSVMHDTYFGLMVSVKHKYGFTTRYAHCSQILVNPGDRVGRGQTVALVGNTGRSSAPHLHYEVLRNGEHVDPLKYVLDHAIR